MSVLPLQTIKSCFMLFREFKKHITITPASSIQTAVTLDSFFIRPIFAFDCSKSDESIKSSMIDVRIEIESSANIPDSTTAYCLIIHDNLFEYSPFSSLVHRVA